MMKKLDIELLLNNELLGVKGGNLVKEYAAYLKRIMNKYLGVSL